MTKVLVSGYIGFNNFGDEAIFWVLSNHLKALGAQVSVLCANKKETKKTYQVKTYNYKKPLQILKAIFSCDILIQGGGSLLQNKTSNFSLIYYLFIILLAKLCFKRVLIFAQGIEPIKGAFFEFLVKIILKSADFITLRDKKSVQYLKKLKIDSTLLSDPVFSLGETTEIEEEKKGLIVQLRNAKNLDDNFLHQLAQSISTYNKEEVSVFSFQGEYDREVCLRFIEILNKYSVKAEFLSNKSILETISIINKAKFLIGMRLHSLICALVVKTKPFGIIYDEKVGTLCEETNLQSVDLVDYSNLDNKLNAFFNHCLNEVHYPGIFNWDCIDNFLRR